MNFGPPIEQPEGITVDPDYVCPTCGALMVERERHTEWHNSLSAALNLIASQAHHAAIWTTVLGAPVQRGVL